MNDEEQRFLIIRTSKAVLHCYPTFEVFLGKRTQGESVCVLEMREVKMINVGSNTPESLTLKEDEEFVITIRKGKKGEKY